MKRVLTAAALIPIVVYTVLFANFWVFLGVVAVVACLCYREYAAIMGAYGFGEPGPAGCAMGLLFLVWGDEAWLILTGATLLSMTLAMRGADLAKSPVRAALTVMGVVYVFGSWRCALPLREANPHWLMYGLLVSWAGDIGAYYVGRSFGRHKMAPRVSPKKSWEGAAASVVTAVVLAGAYLMRFVPQVPLPAVIVLTAAANAAGQIGDLAESALKRGANVKDSGTILPGHGGFLDRVDSTLFALPVIYAYLRMTA